MNTIKKNLLQIQEEIHQVADRVGRDGDEIQLIAVSKTHPPEKVLALYDAGHTVFGENRMQEADEKIQALASYPIEWHFIGHLQRNKAKKAVSLFRLIHSVDSPRLVQALEKEAAKQDENVSILLQVNVAEEQQKFGTSMDDFEILLQSMKESPHINCKGLMIIPPFYDNPEEVRPFFRTLRELGETYRSDLVNEGERLELSMGMSHDFQVAIEEGATMVRVGSALFGNR